MARVTRAGSHLSAEEIKQRLKHDSRPWCRQRWLIIYNALIEPRKAEEIAKHCGVSKATVHQVISTYNRLGVEAVETAGRGGRRHEYLSVEEEKQFLAPFFARARSGEIATATEVKLASARTGWSRGGREHDLPFARSAWMAPASCRARNIPKGVKKSRNALKKLCGAGSGSSRNTGSPR